MDMYTAEQMHVLDVKPGVTSLASIRYRNENELLEKAADPDRYYVEVVMRINLPLISSMCGRLRWVMILN